MYMSDVVKARQARDMADAARWAKIAARTPSFKTSLNDSRIGILNVGGKPMFYAYANGLTIRNRAEIVVFNWLVEHD